MGSGNFQYYGLQNQIEKVLANFAAHEIPSDLQLSICTDGMYNISWSSNFKSRANLKELTNNYNYGKYLIFTKFYRKNNQFQHSWKLVLADHG